MRYNQLFLSSVMFFFMIIPHIMQAYPVVSNKGLTVNIVNKSDMTIVFDSYYRKGDNGSPDGNITPVTVKPGSTGQATFGPSYQIINMNFTYQKPSDSKTKFVTTSTTDVISITPDNCPYIAKNIFPFRNSTTSYVYVYGNSTVPMTQLDTTGKSAMPSRGVIWFGAPITWSNYSNGASQAANDTSLQFSTTNTKGIVAEFINQLDGKTLTSTLPVAQAAS